MRITKKHLKLKGWSDEDAERTIQILTNAEKSKTPIVSFLDKIIFWVSLVIAIIGNIAAAVLLIPVILTISSPHLYLIIMLIGVSFGMLFTTVVSNMDNLQIGHHNVVLFIIPLWAFISFFLITDFVQEVFIMKKLQGIYYPALISMIYVISFLLPYINFLIHHTLIKKETQSA